MDFFNVTGLVLDDVDEEVRTDDLTDVDDGRPVGLRILRRVFSKFLKLISLFC